MKKVKGFKKYKLAVIQNSHGDVKCSIGNIVNNIVLAMYGVRSVLDLGGINL